MHKTTVLLVRTKLTVLHVEFVQNIEREVAVANEGVYNSEDAHGLVQMQENLTATSNVDTDLDDQYLTVMQ